MSHPVRKATLLGQERRLQAESTTAPAARGKARRRPRSPFGKGTPPSARRTFPRQAGSGFTYCNLIFVLRFRSGSTRAETQVQGEGAAASHASLQTPQKAGLCLARASAAATPDQGGEGAGAQERRKREHGRGKGRVDITRSPPPSPTAPSLHSLTYQRPRKP